jgi:hypothetical protein
MPAETNPMPPSQLARWVVIGVLVMGAVVLYFRDGRRMAPLGPSAHAADSAAVR